MALTKTQQTIWERSRSLGAGGQAIGLKDGMCAYLVATIARDLGLEMKFPEVPPGQPGFFAAQELSSLSIDGVDARSLFERLVLLDSDADMYYACLATLHKARLKYEAILETQPMPTLEQVGPRSLLQYGKVSPKALAAFLFWRKWFFDIDNRAGQETGYLFEPIIANAVGGTPVPAGRSPVKRHNDQSKGRQVDCLLGKTAYELKIRVTIAASGQGRWREELNYPLDCRTSGFTPVLVVLDSTPNPKIEELRSAFLRHDGQVYTGNAAWEHLEGLAGPTMGVFLDKYVRAPIRHLIAEASDTLPEMIATMGHDTMSIVLDGETLLIKRRPGSTDSGRPDDIPDDAADELTG